MHSRVSAKKITAHQGKCEKKKGTAGLAVLTSRFSLRLCPYFSSHLSYPAVPLSRFTITTYPAATLFFFALTLLRHYFSSHLPCCALIPLFDYHLPCCDLKLTLLCLMLTLLCLMLT